MVWSIIRIRAARRMFRLSRWLLLAGETIINEEMAKAVDQGRLHSFLAKRERQP